MTATLAVRRRHAAWLPAALLIGYALFAAAGFSIAPNSNAATSTGTATVNATVLPEVHLNFGACGSVVGANATLSNVNLNTSDEDISLGTCALTFGSNNNGTNGASLWIENARTTGGSNSLCNAALPGGCAAPQFADVSTAGVPVATFTAADDGTPTVGAFAVKPSAAGTCPGASADWASTTYYGLSPDTSAALGTQICDTNSTADGSMTLDFRANPGSSQSATTYIARANITAQAT